MSDTVWDMCAASVYFTLYIMGYRIRRYFGPGRLSRRQKRPCCLHMLGYQYDSPDLFFTGRVLTLLYVLYFSRKLAKFHLHANWQSYFHQSTVSSTLSIHSFQFSYPGSKDVTKRALWPFASSIDLFLRSSYPAELLRYKTSFQLVILSVSS